MLVIPTVSSKSNTTFNVHKTVEKTIAASSLVMKF